MALLFIDGFDHYTTGTQKWDSQSGVEAPSYTSSTRLGSGFAVVFGGPNSFGVKKNMTIFNDGNAYSEVYTGFAFQMTSGVINDGEKFVFSDSAGTEVATLHLNSSQNFELRRGGSPGTVIATGTINISADTWYYVELKYIPLNSGGTFEVKVDTVVDATFTGDTTAGLEDVATVQLGGDGANGAGEDNFDDFYFCDNTGADNNTYLGDVRVVTEPVTTETAQIDFTPSVGTDNAAMLDEINTIDGDTTYVENGSISATDRMTTGPLGLTGTVFGVQVSTAARKTDTSTRAYKASVKSGATTVEDGIEHTLNTSYQIYTDMYQDDPATGVDWTVSGVDSFEVGYKVTI